MYTYFRKDKKVLCVIQIVEDTSSTDDIIASVMPHPAGTMNDAADGSPSARNYFYDDDKPYADVKKDSIEDSQQGFSDI